MRGTRRGIAAGAAAAALLVLAAGGCRRGGAELGEDGTGPEPAAPAQGAASGGQVSGEEAAALHRAIDLDTAAAYSEFLKRYPASPKAALARGLLERRLFDAAAASSDASAFATFLERFPEGPLALAARAELDRRDFAEASKAGTLEALEGYLAKHPRGAAAEEARGRIEAVRAKTLVAVLDIKAVRYKTTSFTEIEEQFRRRMGPKLAEAGLEWTLVSPASAPKRPPRYRLDVEYAESQGLPYSDGFGTNVDGAFRLVEAASGRVLWERKLFASTSYEVNIDPQNVAESLRKDAVDLFWTRFDAEFQPGAWGLSPPPAPASAR